MMAFHKSSLSTLVYKAAANSSYIDRPSEAVVFAVYFCRRQQHGSREMRRQAGPVARKSRRTGYDTKLPLNINDSDLSPESSQPPEAQSDFTEMAFCLVRIEIIVYHPPRSSNAPGSDDSNRSRLRERYLQFCDTSVSRTMGDYHLVRSYPIMADRSSLAGNDDGRECRRLRSRRWIDRDLQKGGVTLETAYSLMERAAAAHGRIWRIQSCSENRGSSPDSLGNVDPFAR